MRITFILNQVGQCGGVINVLNIAKELAKRGHKVSVRYPSDFSWKRYARSILSRNRVSWIDTTGIDVKMVPWLSEKFIPDGDAVVATWWETVYSVKNYSKRKGEKFYYVQHDESLWGGPDESVNWTYNGAGLRIITNSRWTRNQIEEKGVKVESIVYPGISENFYPLYAYDKFIMPFIGAAYRDQHWKGWEDIVKAFGIVQSKHQGIMLVSYGHKFPETFRSNFWLSPSDPILNRLYNNFTVFVSASFYEGFSMTPLEAMRCKTPVCTTRVGVFQDFKDTGAFVSEPRDPAALAKNVLHVLENDVSKNVERAYEFARQFTFEKSAAAMEGALLS